MTESSNSPSWQVTVHERTQSGDLLFRLTSVYGTSWSVTCESDGSWFYTGDATFTVTHPQKTAMQAAIGRYLVTCYHKGQAFYNGGMI